jgi:hypothetical protein
MKDYSNKSKDELYKLYEDTLLSYELYTKEAVEINDKLQNKLIVLIEIRKELFDMIGEFKKRGEKIEGFFENEPSAAG